MGLFDSLKKNLDTISKEVGKVAGDLQKELEQYKTNQPAQAPQQQAYQAPQPQQSYQAPKAEEGSVYPKFTAERDQTAKFDDIIARHFADCTVRKNVPAAELKPDCHPACTPVQYMFYRDGRPVLAIVLVSRRTYNGMNVKGTKMICENLGINYERFYNDMENEESYVVNRIRENL